MTSLPPQEARTFEQLKDELIGYLPKDITAAQLSVELVQSDEPTTLLIPSIVYEQDGKFYSPSDHIHTDIPDLLVKIFAKERLAGRNPIFIFVFIRDGVLTHEFEYVEEVGTEQTLYMRAVKAQLRFFGRIVEIEVPKAEIDHNNMDAPQMVVEDED